MSAWSSAFLPFPPRRSLLPKRSRPLVRWPSSMNACLGWAASSPYVHYQCERPAECLVAHDGTLQASPQTCPHHHPHGAGDLATPSKSQGSPLSGPTHWMPIAQCICVSWVPLFSSEPASVLPAPGYLDLLLPQRLLQIEPTSAASTNCTTGLLWFGTCLCVAHLTSRRLLSTFPISPLSAPCPSPLAR